MASTTDRVNLGNAKLTATLTTSATTVTLDDASVFSGISGDFYATIMPAGEMSRKSNSEIVKCTYATATTLTIVRAQRGTTAKEFPAGAILTNGIYDEDVIGYDEVSGSGGAGLFNAADLDWTSLIDKIYPVGSIYMSLNDVSPATFIGGTWEKIERNFLFGSDDNFYPVGSQGGSYSHQHTLSSAGWARGAVQSGVYKYAEIGVPAHSVSWQLSGQGGSASGTISYATALGGKTDTEATMPPYLAVYMWKRTA